MSLRDLPLPQMKFPVLASLLLVLFSPLSRAEITLPKVLSDHMVLQRDMPVPIWGTASPDEAITVTFQTQQKTTKADKAGHWRVTLNPLSPGKPGTLTVTGTSAIQIKDVLVGEVWLGSGQSNLDTDVPDYVKLDQPLAEAAATPHPGLRIFRSDVENGWQEVTPQTLRRFSAQLFYFGFKLHQELGVPVGLMEGAVRGSPSKSWLSQAAYQSDAQIRKAVLIAADKNPYQKKLDKYNEAMKQWQTAYDEAIKTGLPEAKLPKQPIKPIPVGEEITGDLYERHIRPMIPFALRGVLWDQGEGGTGLEIYQRVITGALIRSWRNDWQQGDFPWLIVQKPSGEGCALDPKNPINLGAAAATALPERPPAWQEGWPPRWDWLGIPKDNPNVFLVPTSDLATGVHPANKSGYGSRDSQVALGAVYGKAVAFSGPAFTGILMEGGKVRVSFDHVGKGLTAPPGHELQGFALAGEDKKFFWANAIIEGTSVVLSSPEVPNPVAARYAWAPYNITWANLFNNDGLPALSFRSDAW